MKRIIAIKLVIFLLLGAVVNVAVAWGYALGIKPLDELPLVREGDEIVLSWGDAATTLYPIRMPGYRAYVMEFVHLGGPPQGGDAREALRRTTIPAWVVGLADTPKIAERTTIQNEPLPLADRYEAFGWPTGSMASATYRDVTNLTNWQAGPMKSMPTEGVDYVVHYHASCGISTGQTQKGLGRERLIVLPIRPLPGRFIINTVFYALVLWLLWSLAFATRRLIRRRRGKCVRCGYDLSGAEHDVCPECGV